ncbi:MAG: apolipoprotein N-acyltransferase [Elusimicrobiota bacterium]
MLRKIGRAQAFLSLASGAALALCLPKPGLCLLAWIAPAFLLFFASRAASAGAAAVLGALFGYAYCLVSLFWIYSTCRFAGVPFPLAVLVVNALAAFLAVNWALYGAAVRWTGEKLPAAALPWAWAALWAALESASAHWTPRVGVDLLAYTQYRFLYLIQIGALLGPHALGFAIMLWNGALVEFFCGTRDIRYRRNLAAAGALVVLFGAYGAAVLASRQSDAGTAGGVRVEILQPNIDQYQKWDENYELAIRSIFNDLLDRRREGAPGLVVWPESALPGWLDDPRNPRWASSWAQKLGAPMLVGAVSEQIAGKRNLAVFFGADGAAAGYYHKRRLVPFGEFVPLRGLLEGWIGILAQMGDFDAGTSRQPLLEAAGLRLAANICYEAVFPHLLRLDSARGARVFVNLTNDGWYKDTAGPHQHFYTNMFRAVENRVTVLRAANTGISGAIDPYGVVLARTELGARTRLDLRLPAGDPFPRGSLFSRTGDVFGFACMFAAVMIFAWPALAARRRRK